MEKLLEKYGVGKSIKLTSLQEKKLDSIELGDYDELLDVDISGDDIVIKDLELNGLKYSFYDKSNIKFNVSDIVKWASKAEATVQTLNIFLVIIDISKVEALIQNLFNMGVSETGFILKKGETEIRIRKIQTAYNSFLSFFQTNNPKVINPRYWISESFSTKSFDKLKDPSFYLLHKALQYSIYQVLRRSQVGRHDLTIQDIEEEIFESGDIEVYTYNQMEDSKVHRKFNLIIKKI